MNNNYKNIDKSSRINYKDNIKILKYYNINIPKSRKQIKQKAEKILSNKLCRCINKLQSHFKERSVGICTKTIFNNKNLKRGTFKCKKTHATIKFRKFNKTKKSILTKK